MATPMGRNAARFARRMSQSTEEALLRDAVRKPVDFAAAVAKAGGCFAPRQPLPKRKA